MPQISTIEKYRPFRIKGNDTSVFRVNGNSDIEVFITNARFTTVPDNKWTTRITNNVHKSQIEYYDEKFVQPEAFTEKEKYRYA